MHRNGQYFFFTMEPPYLQNLTGWPHSNQVKIPCDFAISPFYRPHPKDGGRQYFHFVCQSTPQRGWGDTPSQVWKGGGYTIPGLDGGGGVLPIPGLDGGILSHVWIRGYPPNWDLMGYTPVKDWTGYPLIRQSRIASTCCVAVGMPFAFTLEDFLVSWLYFHP